MINIQKNISSLTEEIDVWETLKKEIDELYEIISLDDFSAIEAEVKQKILKIEKQYANQEIKSFLSGSYDKNNAYLSIYSGAGGDDSADWAKMLLRMYSRYCESKNYEYQIVSCSSAEKGGIKEATIYIKARYSYGMLKMEGGVHRLVRLSPFSSAALRHTSFALVDIIPELDNNIDISIKEENLKIDFFRSSGPGGQSVNKRDTAVRITHIPTKISATSQGERSQASNRDRAYNILSSKLYMIKIKENAQKIADIKGDFSTVQWGSQIRSYVMHPYKLVKDHRTEFEESDVEKVLDGDIDEFIKSTIYKN